MISLPLATASPKFQPEGRDGVQLGFVGTGTLATALVEALAQRVSPPPKMLLSPRSAIRSDALAGKFDTVNRLESNQDVVASARIVFLGMRPQDFSAAVDGLTFRGGQVVVSLLARTSLAEIGTAIGEALPVRLLALPSIASGPAPLAIYPRNETLLTLLAPLGSVMVLEQEAQFDALFTAAGFISTFLELQNIVAGKLVERGLPASEAYTFVNLMLDGLVRAAGAAGRHPRDDLVAAHETPGGLNARCRSWLREAGWFSEVDAAFDRLRNSIL